MVLVFRIIVSGHLDLSKATGAPIIYGPGTKTNFPVHVAKDGETFKLGELTFEVLHTPGHTLESSCYLLKDATGKNHSIFTGDTLFVGDVGRPDLAQKGAEITMADLAGMMYDSIHTKLFPLEDEVLVYPAHGPGSSCGKNLGPNTHSTIGEEKQNNYALKAATKEEFIQQVTDGIQAPPTYFPINAKINKEGYDSLDNVLVQGLKGLSVKKFKAALTEDTIILDTRNATVFTEGFIPGSISIGLEGRFAEWAGSILPFESPMLLVTEQGQEKETIVRLARVGFDKASEEEQAFLDGLPKPLPENPEREWTMELLYHFVKKQCIEHEISAALLLPKGDFNRLKSGSEDFDKSLLVGWRAELMGAELVEWMKKGGKVKVKWEDGYCKLTM